MISEAPIRYLSNSQVELLLECSWKHKLKYIDGISEQPNEHIIIGAAVHKGVETYRIAQLENRLGEWSEQQRNQACLNALNEEFDKLVYNAENGIANEGSSNRPVSVGVNWSRGMNAERSRSLAKQLLSVYFYREAESDITGMEKVPLAHMETPVSIEEEFMVPIPNTTWFAKGRFDMRTKDRLIDLKTAKQRYSQKEMDKKTQPSMYSMALLAKSGEWAPEFYFHILIKPNKSVWSPDSGEMPPTSLQAYRAAVQRTRRSASEILWFTDNLRSLVNQIETGSQVKRQNADWCDYCGVAKSCKPWLSGSGQGEQDVIQLLRESFSHVSAGHSSAGQER